MSRVYRCRYDGEPESAAVPITSYSPTVAAESFASSRRMVGVGYVIVTGTVHGARAIWRYRVESRTHYVTTTLDDEHR